MSTSNSDLATWMRDVFEPAQAKAREDRKAISATVDPKNAELYDAMHSQWELIGAEYDAVRAQDNPELSLEERQSIGRQLHEISRRFAKCELDYHIALLEFKHDTKLREQAIDDRLRVLDEERIMKEYA